MIASLVSPPLLRRLLLPACFFLVTTSESLAQAKKNPTQVQTLATHRGAHDAAKGYAVSGNFAAAAQMLDALGAAPGGSADRLFETAQRLTTLASTLSRDGNASAAQQAAAAALQYLAEANRRTNDADIKANLQALAGFLHERYLGDLETAKAAYQAAAQLAPENESVREKVERIEHTEAEARAKAGQNHN
jgi:hypothetical protein